MELGVAIEVVEELRAGYPSETEADPDDGRVRVGAALDEALRLLRAADERRRRRPAKAFARWTDEDDARLVKLHGEGVDPTELARRFERTRGAVRTRLFLLGCLQLGADEDPPRPRFPAAPSG